jgi:hypothetical protein
MRRFELQIGLIVAKIGVQMLTKNRRKKDKCIQTIENKEIVEQDAGF